MTCELISTEMKIAENTLQVEITSAHLGAHYQCKNTGFLRKIQDFYSIF
jgi:hypothetical protein